MSDAICIYCLATGVPRFHKEHVVPRAFGHFRDNLTLDCVCAGCNEYFSKDLELFLTRNSIEALMRVRYGLETKRGRRKLGSRLDIRVISAGEWYGSRVAVARTEDGTTLTAEPLPQVGFRKPGESDYNWLLEEELELTERWNHYREDAEIIIAGSSEEVQARIAKQLARLDLRIKKLVPIPSPRREVEVFAEPLLDDIIFRGVAKIAFNALAYSQGPRYVLMSDFDSIRDYVRLGKTLRQPPVVVRGGPMLRGDDLFHGHDVILRRNQRGIECLVSLFNHHVYRIALCSDYTGTLWHPLNEWNRFDPRTHVISNVAREMAAIPTGESIDFTSFQRYG
jgi:hypothetical protein